MRGNSGEDLKMKQAFRSLSFLSFDEADLGGESASLSDSVSDQDYRRLLFFCYIFMGNTNK